jgi:hypothetical protein
MTFSVRLFFLIISLGFFNQSKAQSGYNLLDSCVAIQYGGSDTTITLRYYLYTDSGNYYVNNTYASNNQTWTTNSSPIIQYNYFGIYDSLNRITESFLFSDSTGHWEYYRHTVFTYDIFGMIDSLQQYFDGVNWIDFAEWTWQKDSTGAYVFWENKFDSAGQWNNGQKMQWYFDNQHWDTLVISYVGNLTQWIPEHEVHHVYDSNGIIDYFEIGYTGGIPFNISKTTYFYQFPGEDTLRINFNGNMNAWDTLSRVFRVFDGFGNVIQETLIYYNGGNWNNSTRTSYTYDNLNRIITTIYETSDTLLGWLPTRMDSIIYGSYGGHNDLHLMWNGSSWECYEFENLNFISPFEFYSSSGMLDATDCLISGYYSDEFEIIDSAGHTVYHEFDGHAGDSEGNSNYDYDSNGNLIHEHHWSSSMGGIVHESDCYYNTSFLFSFEQFHFTACPGDTINIIAHPSIRNFSFQWRYNNQLLPDTTPFLLNHIVNAGGWYSMTMSDQYGNYYRDSVKVDVHPMPDLGNDTTVCLGDTVIFNPGSFSSYVWNNGSVQPTFSVVSAIPDSATYWVIVTDSTGCSNTDSVNINFSVCQVITDLTSDRVRIFPNPSAEYLFIENTELILAITIYNSLGEKLAVYDIQGTSLRLNISHLTCGIYFVEILSAKGRALECFAKGEN